MVMAKNLRRKLKGYCQFTLDGIHVYHLLFLSTLLFNVYPVMSPIFQIRVVIIGTKISIHLMVLPMPTAGEG